MAKLYAHQISRYYRNTGGVFISNGILFNHESEIRDPSFVTRKVTLGLARIKLGLQNELILGNIDAQRDWGYAPDFVEAMWLMLQKDYPDEFVISTGISHSLRDFLEIAADIAGLDENWQDLVKVDSALLRPIDAVRLIGDYSKAHNQLGWKPKVTFKEMIHRMVINDLEMLQKK